MSHLSSMEFLGRDPTSQAAPEQQGYFWSRLRFSSEPFSPQFCPRTTAHPWAAATLTELCMVLGWSRDPLLKCGGGHLQEHPWEGGKEGVSPLQAWTSACRRDNKQMDMSQARSSRGADQQTVPRLRAMDVCCLQAAEKELNSMIQQASAPLPGKLLCSEDLCQS